MKLKMLYLLGIGAMLSCSSAQDQADEAIFTQKDLPQVATSEQIAQLRNKAEQSSSLPDWVELAQFCKEIPDFDCALDAAARSFRIDSTNVDARSLYAWSLINKPEPPLIDIERAKRHYKYVLAIQPNNAQLMVELANAYSLTGDFESSFTLINKALKINDRLRDAYILKGSNYRIVGNYELALSSYQTAVQMDPKYFLGNLQTAYLLTEMERHGLAVEYYQNAAEINPESVEALYGVAKSFQDMGSYDEARVAYNAILAVDEKFFISYFNQGFIKQYLVNELDSAVYYYSLCLELQPEYVKAWHNLGETYYMQGRNADAARAFTEVLHLNPNYEPTLIAKEKLRKK